MKAAQELEVAVPVGLVVLLLFCICTALVCHGVNPLRVLRSSFKVPRRAHGTLSGSDREREALLAVDRKTRALRRGVCYCYFIAWTDGCGVAAMWVWAVDRGPIYR